MKRTLFLHIGLHKTGTTSIQRALYLNKELLVNNGVGFFCSNRKGKEVESGNALSWVPGGGKEIHHDLYVGNGAKPVEVDNLVTQLRAVTGDAVLMSNENFSWIFDENELIGLHAKLSEYFNVRLIVYLRRQDRLAISHFQQASKSRKFPSYGYYRGGNKALPSERDHYDEYLDYNRKLSMWGEVFGFENLTVRVFEKTELYSGDVIADFFRVIGIGSNFRINGSYNESNGLERTKLGHLINYSNLDGELGGLLRRATSNSGKSLPSREEAQSFYEQYRASNIELNKKLNISSKYADIFNGDFSDYPEEASDCWTEESANAAISNILNSLEVFNGLGSDEFRDTAIKLEKSDLALSYKYMKLALSMRPDGKFIQKKLSEYEAALSAKNYSGAAGKAGSSFRDIIKRLRQKLWR